MSFNVRARNRWQRVIDQTSMGGFQPSLTMALVDKGPARIVVRFTITAPSWKPPYELQKFEPEYPLPLGIRTDFDCAHYLLHLVEFAMTHEIREHFHFNNQRIFAPH